MGGALSTEEAQGVTAEKTLADATGEAAAPAEKAPAGAEGDVQKTILTSLSLKNAQDEAQTPAGVVATVIASSGSSPKNATQKGAELKASADKAAVEMASSELVVAEVAARKQELAELAAVEKSGADNEEEISAGQAPAESLPSASDSIAAIVTRECEARTFEVDRRIGRRFEGLFPGRDLKKSPPAHTIVTLAIKTRNRMSAMSTEMLSERAECFELLIGRMQAFRDKLAVAGYWCDFIDPSSGAPFHSDSATTFAETDDRVRTFGFEILELGCCRVTCHKTFGQCMVMTTAFVEATTENIADALKLLETDP